MKVAEIWTAEPHEGRDTFFFASLDGEHYIGITHPPLSGDEPDVQRLLDGDGHFKPMTVSERGLRMMLRDGDELEITEV